MSYYFVVLLLSSWWPRHAACVNPDVFDCQFISFLPQAAQSSLNPLSLLFSSLFSSLLFCLLHEMCLQQSVMLLMLLLFSACTEPFGRNLTGSRPPTVHKINNHSAHRNGLLSNTQLAQMGDQIESYIYRDRKFILLFLSDFGVWRENKNFSSKE